MFLILFADMILNGDETNISIIKGDKLGWRKG